MAFRRWMLFRYKKIFNIMKYKLNLCEFYITNVCNLNCPNCASFNNYAFKGNYSWSAYEDVYKKWAEILDITAISILGGEPTLSPEFMNYVNGVRSLWKDAKISVKTNGARLRYYKDLYDSLLKNNVYIELSVHNSNDWEKKISDVRQFLVEPIDEEYLVSADFGVFDSVNDLIKRKTQEWVEKYNSIKSKVWPDCCSPDDFLKLPDSIKKECIEVFKLDPNDYLVTSSNTRYLKLTDKHNVTVILIKSDQFYRPAIILKDNEFFLHNSNPTVAVNSCTMKDCHQFINGKLYKCPVSGVLPEFIAQFPVNASEEDKQIINSYKPANVDDSLDFLNNFFENLHQGKEISQCKFCPENLIRETFAATNKKIKINRV